MTLNISRLTTRMDKRGNVFVHRDIRKIMGLEGGGQVEFYINQDGQLAFRKSKPSARRPK